MTTVHHCLLHTSTVLLSCPGNGLDPESGPKTTLEVYGPLGIRRFITTALGISRSPLVYKWDARSHATLCKGSRNIMYRVMQYYVPGHAILCTGSCNILCWVMQHPVPACRVMQYYVPGHATSCAYHATSCTVSRKILYRVTQHPVQCHATSCTRLLTFVPGHAKSPRGLRSQVVIHNPRESTSIFWPGL